MVSLGFGVLVCLGREIELSLFVIMYEFFCCYNCGAYVNQYSIIVLNIGYWSCMFCNKFNDSNGEYRVFSIDELWNWLEFVISVVDYVDFGIFLVFQKFLIVFLFLLVFYVFVNESWR